MTRKDAVRRVGQIVLWNDMDARIDQTTVILERIGHHSIATITYRVEYRPERFSTYKHVSELYS